MKITSFYNNLIHSIEIIYSRVTVRILHKRMSAYHQQSRIDSSTMHIHDIKAPLFKYIEDTNNNHREEILGAQTLDYSFFSQGITTSMPSHHEFSKQRVVNKNNVDELSRYFKGKQNHDELHPGIVEKLKHSTWDHIHAAIRRARLGDEHAAIMHTDIANYAIRELAHYLTKEEYFEFTAHIDDQLELLLNHK